jgi:hypothetical protein
MKRTLWAALAIAAVMAIGGVAKAQAQSSTGIESYIEMLRTDVKSARKAIIDAALDLPDDKANAFWPVYRKYQLDLDSWGDKRMAVIKDYAANYESMTDKKAEELAKTVFSNHKSRIAMLEKYYKEFSKVIGPTAAARLTQVEMAMNSVIDLQIATELPLIEPGTVPATAGGAGK